MSVYKVAYKRNCVGIFKLLDICIPVPFDAVHMRAVDDSGHNNHACTTQLGTHMIQFVTNRRKQLLMLGVNKLGRSRHLGKQLIRLS